MLAIGDLKPLKSKTKKQRLKTVPFPAAESERLLEKAKALAEPLCRAEGLELVFAEFQAEPAGRILRFYIDRPGGVTLDDCVAVSRQLSDILDVGLDSDDPYNLEVSSPGSDRPVGKLEDFQRFKGRNAKIQTSRPVDGRKNFKGTLAGVENDLVKIMTAGETVAIKFDTITRARLINYNGES